MTARCTVYGLVKSLLLAGLVLMPALLYADSSSSDKAYTVKKGDTLWGISTAKFNNPYQWKRIWKANPFIRNPHWIYPGQKLVLPDSLGDGDLAGRGDGSILRIKPTPMSSTLVPVQKANRLASRQDFLAIGYISNKLPAGAGRIFGMGKDKTIVANGDFVYLELGEPAQLGKRYYVYAVPEEIKHPATNEKVGNLIRIKGIVSIAPQDNDLVRAEVVEAITEIHTGDVIGPYFEVDAPYFVGEARKPAVNATVVRILGQKELGGSFEALHIDKGSRDGLRLGDLVNVFSAREPKAFIGTIQIINASETASSAVVKASNSEILIGDTVKN